MCLKKIPRMYVGSADPVLLAPLLLELRRIGSAYTFSKRGAEKGFNSREGI